ncbi:MAG: ABC transporter ATP-binding protein [Chlorobium sp.]|jgi:putative ABC transport system ATP-binding protein|uniref:ABC transporter ATP-binding protein n=1 Tax=Chlorobium sp. TaxID=1095 RepID=UPI001DD11D26|nr:ABC transporter ATP-binding protein [Chlorobium sp.]MBN1279278.1 ABC transporter ATP-binding protein [Chlorobiaceae bacterium]MCF8216244.1 ABC transporter ATP-binding protein [Chlorobium sp.]MCF8271146.1 ABC transporter ATP-binding protein [Chlorobium sp.]MCF8287520.1 ABC transporter ATP-binding protein [Chlorobium sp.]MCF8291059.1 ABC transporter ATP-binding protein [Chlorobium sp.]
MESDSESISHGPPVLKISGLSKTYLMGEVTVEALKHVSIDFFSGELVVLLGASGSGKSTLLNIIGGLDVPSEGKLFFHGREITAATEAELTAYRRRSIGFVFQFYNLISSLSALENVQLVTDIAEDPMQAEEALRLVGLGNRLHHFPAQLSGGEQQRVAIARAVAKRPELLLCDEPTGALDFQTGKLVLEVIEKVNRELGTTTLVITHNASIAGMADRVVRLGSGTVTEDRRNFVRMTPSELVW